MSEKPVAFMVTLLAVAPLCLLCILGPTLIGGFFAGWFGWFADLSAGVMVLLAILGTAVVFGIIKSRHKQRQGLNMPPFRQSH